MLEAASKTRMEELRDLTVEESTLLVGLPGLGLVGVISVDTVTDQLDLDHYGNFVSTAFPRVATFADGRVRDPLRVYADDDPSVMTLQGDLVFPPRSHTALADAVVDHLAESVDRVVLPVGAPTERVDEHGTVTGVATTEALRTELEDADVPLAPGVGAVGGAAGAVVTECYRADLPAAILIVRTDPYRPDPAAARSLIEDALNPVVAFEVDTADLEAEQEALEAEMRAMARQMREFELQRGLEGIPPESEPSMFQ